MTREEKINTLKAIIQECEEYQWWRKKALFEIIKELEQKSCEDVPNINDGNIYKCSCGYGWNKSKVVRHHFCPNCGKPVDGSIKTGLKPCEGEDCISRQYLLDNCVVDKVTMPYVPVNKIENAPPVVPQQKTGRWIHNKCDKCGASRPPLFDNYCPNCGAKMEVKE